MKRTQDTAQWKVRSDGRTHSSEVNVIKKKSMQSALGNEVDQAIEQPLLKLIYKAAE